MSAGPAEVHGLTQSIGYARHLAALAALHGPDGNEAYLLRLQAARVTGDGLTTGSAMQQAFATAAAAATAHAAELDTQTSVQEAYDATPDAGGKTYLTGDTTSSAAPGPGPDQAKEIPVHDTDAIDPLTGMRPDTLAAFREYTKATRPFLNRRTELQRIEDEHDARPELLDRGQRTADWYQAAGVVLRARTEQIDRMVATLRAGDEVRQVDDPHGVVWMIRETRDGNDGQVWLGLLRTREDEGTEVASGCRARGIDLVFPATDDDHIAMVKSELLNGLRAGWLTQEAYDAAIAEVDPPASRAPGPGTDAEGLRRWRRDEMILAQAQELYGDEETPEAKQVQRDADAVIRRRRQAHRAAVLDGVTPCAAARARTVPCVHPDGDHHQGLCFAADGGAWPRHMSWWAPETWAGSAPAAGR